jgi:hypothetical protein
MKLPLFLIGIIILLLIGLCLVIYGHEVAHVQINNYFGAESHIEFDLTGIRTIPDSDFGSVESRNQAYLGHSINDAIGYQIVPLFFVLFGIIILTTKTGDKK